MELRNKSVQANEYAESARMHRLAKSYVIAMERLGQEPHPYLSEMAQLSPEEAATFQPDESMQAEYDQFKEAQIIKLALGINIRLAKLTNPIGGESVEQNIAS